MRVIQSLTFILAVLILSNCKPRSASTVAGPFYISCPATSAPADIVSIPNRAGYILDYNGGTITNVIYYGGTNAPGTYNFSLTVRDGSFSGTVLGTATATANLGTPSVGGNAIHFVFNPVVVVPQVSGNKTVTFEVTNLSGGTVYAVYEPVTSATCPMIETNGNTPPLDTANGTRAWATYVN